MEPAIKVENLSKRFTIGAFVAYGTLRDTIARLFRRDVTSPNDLWALDDVSFEIPAGEAVAVIGRNGAGKTTLLKILARILRPTSGRGEIRGRIASLLEIGTGFHGELTGRDNVFMNGTILGMKPREIRARYDSIVQFAELERFMDTPVKHYSSGMQARLAFSVAAHLEADILLVDEVLAVGDAAFQRKCMGKMSETTGQGRTVIFVSHNMQAVIDLCRRGLLLDNGKLKADGPTADVVAAYHATLQAEPPEVTWTPESAPGDETVRLLGARVRNARGDVAFVHSTADPVTIEIDFRTFKPDLTIVPRLHVATTLGVLVFSAKGPHDGSAGPLQPEPGRYRASCEIPADFLNVGHYGVGLALLRDAHVPLVKQAVVLYFQIARDGGLDAGGDGVVRPRLPWTLERVNDAP